MFSAWLIRSVLGLVTCRMQIWKTGKEPIKTPPQFLCFSTPPNRELLEDLASTYCQIFGEKPWREKHSEKKVIQKLLRETAEANSRLVVMKGDRKVAVAGFCWGRLITPDEIPERVAQARHWQVEQAAVQLRRIMEILSGRSLLFLDEMALHSSYRRGLSPVQFLLRPLLELAWEAGVKEALFWTREESKIKALASYMGFYPICKTEPLVFMLNPDLRPLLKLTQNLNAEQGITIMKFVSLFVRDRGREAD